MPLAVPVPANGVAGVDVSAAFWNAQVRDAVTFLLNAPHCVMYQTIAQSGSVPTAVLFDTNEVDSYGGHSTVTNTSLYVAQVAGWYQCSGVVPTNASGTAGSTREVSWFKNGAAIIAAVASEWAQAVTRFTGTSAPTREIFLNVGDSVSLVISGNGTAWTTQVASNINPMATIRWVHA